MSDTETKTKEYYIEQDGVEIGSSYRSDLDAESARQQYIYDDRNQGYQHTGDEYKVKVRFY